jgi:hypothetical protein
MRGGGSRRFHCCCAGMQSGGVHSAEVKAAFSLCCFPFCLFLLDIFSYSLSALFASSFSRRILDQRRSMKKHRRRCGYVCVIIN